MRIAMGQARTSSVRNDGERTPEQENMEDSHPRARLAQGEDGEHTHVRRAETAAAPAKAAGDTGRVLLVDDHAELRRVWLRVLRRAGHEVHEATSAAEALERIRTECYELVLSDIQMPDMTGLELLAKLRTLDPELAVVLLTGAPDAASVQRAEELGASEFLTKPVDLARLTGTVGRCVAQTRRQRAR
jgi:CheY-like chemotaxis protein